MKKAAPTTARPRDAGAPAWSFWLWLAATFLVVLIVIVIGTAWAVRHATLKKPLLSEAQSRMVMAVAEFPGLVITVVRELPSRIKGDPVPWLMDRNVTSKPHWIRRFPAPEDSGYLLFSGLDPVAKHSIVQLIRISDGAIIARWDPDWPALLLQITTKK